MKKLVFLALIIALTFSYNSHAQSSSEHKLLNEKQLLELFKSGSEGNAEKILEFCKSYNMPSGILYEHNFKENGKKYTDAFFIGKTVSEYPKDSMCITTNCCSSFQWYHDDMAKKLGFYVNIISGSTGYGKNGECSFGTTTEYFESNVMPYGITSEIFGGRKKGTYRMQFYRDNKRLMLMQLKAGLGEAYRKLVHMYMKSLPL